MLKLTPRTITAAILTFFVGLIFVQQLSFHIMSTKADSDYDRLVKVIFQDTPWLNALSWVERVDYDVHLRFHNPGRRHNDVAVIEINEQSIFDLGYFPFSRSVYKTLIEKLELAGAKVVAFDITFSERERNALSQLQEFREELIQTQGYDSTALKLLEDRIFKVDSDEQLANALVSTKLPVIMGYSFADEDASLALKKSQNMAQDDEKLKEVKALMRDFQVRPRAQGVTRIGKDGRELPLVSSIDSMEDRRPVINLPDLMRSLNKRSGIGQFLPSADPDSVIRRVPLFVEYDGMILGSLAVHAAAAYLGEEVTYLAEGGSVSARGVVKGEGGRPVDGRLYAPLSPRGDMMARYYGGPRIFPYVEFSEIVLGRLSDEDLKARFGGKMVFVGVTAVGLKDIRATPFTRDYPGVEVHATVASNILQGSFMHRDSRFFWYGYAMLLLFGVLSAVAVYRFHPLASFVTTALMMAILQVGSHTFFFDHGVVVPTILPSLCCFAVFFSGMLYRYFTEEREKKVVRAAFGRYVSSAVVEEILKDQSKLRLGGQKKELTVMFVDLVNFTTIAEHLDAGVVTTLLNEYFTRMTRILLANKGTLDKYMGDGIMCFWGAPLDLPDHARMACKTALEMQAEVARINAEWRTKHGITIEIRVGVHTGDMAVGNMGSDQVFSYTVMGDAVNLGSRLEGVNTVYGTRIIVSSATAAKCGEGFLFRPLDRVQVKGKEDAVQILELVSMLEGREPEWVHAFRTGLKHYQAGEWDDAESAFGACLTLKPGDGPSQVFVERIRDFRIVQPDEWSGVWKLSQK